MFPKKPEKMDIKIWLSLVIYYQGKNVFFWRVNNFLRKCTVYSVHPCFWVLHFWEISHMLLFLGEFLSKDIQFILGNQMNVFFYSREFLRIIFICICWYIVSSSNGVLGNMFPFYRNEWTMMLGIFPKAFSQLCNFPSDNFPKVRLGLWGAAACIQLTSVPLKSLSE